MNIDAHHHLWKYSAAEYGWITPEMRVFRRDFLPEQLEELMHHFGIEGTVAVQARRTLEETAWLLSLAEKHPLIRGVVGWVPLTEGAGVKRHLEQFAGNHRLRGVRHVIHDEPDPRYILREDFNAGVSALQANRIALRHFDLRATFARRHRIRGPASLPGFHPGSRGQAAHQGADSFPVGPQHARNGQAAKRILQTFRDGDGSRSRNTGRRGICEPYIEVVLAAFGPRRIMYGSDWPVLLRASDYASAGLAP